MADRKVYVEVTLRLILRVNDGVDVSEILDDMDFTPVNERKAEALGFKWSGAWLRVERAAEPVGVAGFLGAVARAERQAEQGVQFPRLPPKTPMPQ